MFEHLYVGRCSRLTEHTVVLRATVMVFVPVPHVWLLKLQCRADGRTYAR